MNAPRLALVLLVAGATSWGCRSSDRTRAPTQTAPEPHEVAATQPMAEHFLKISAIKDAVIAGELEATREPAQWLLDEVVAENLPLDWRPHVPALHRAAKAVLAATDLDTAAHAAAEAAKVCGDCHADVGIEVQPSDAPAPLTDETQFAHMGRHAWAADRMWDGLIAPSDEAWTRGAEGFMEAPLHDDDVPADQAELANRVHGIAASAATQTDRAERAGHFGELIATCAACHTQTKAAAG